MPFAVYNEDKNCHKTRDENDGGTRSEETSLINHYRNVSHSLRSLPRSLFKIYTQIMTFSLDNRLQSLPASTLPFSRVAACL